MISARSSGFPCNRFTLKRNFKRHAVIVIETYKLIRYPRVQFQYSARLATGFYSSCQVALAATMESKSMRLNENSECAKGLRFPFSDPVVHAIRDHDIRFIIFL